jgi:hypothetical protein
MTKLEELKADSEAARAARDAALDAYEAAVAAACYDAGAGALVAWDTYAEAAYVWRVANDAYKAELKKKQEENSMTKLEELKVALDDADVAYDAARAAARDARDAASDSEEAAYAAEVAAQDAGDAFWAVKRYRDAALDAYDELKKTQEENSND